jgi:uncharacterized CHY-type Zn-finger protein
MKRKKIEALKPLKTEKIGEIVTVQMMDETLILNIYSDQIMQGRYCIVTSTGEHEYWVPEKGWSTGKLSTLLLGYKCGYAYGCIENFRNYAEFDPPVKEKEIRKLLPKNRWENDVWGDIIQLEENYDGDKRSRAEERRQKRIYDMMSQIPECTKDMKKWIIERESDKDYAFWKKSEGLYGCTNCGSELKEKQLKRTDGGTKIRHNDLVLCPKCKKIIQIKKRNQQMKKKTALYLIQPAGTETSVIRFFDVEILWEYGKKEAYLDEGIRIMAYKTDAKKKSKKGYDIYYDQLHLSFSPYSTGFDKGNNANRRAKPGYLYPGPIEAVLDKTIYESAGRILEQMAAGKLKLNYNGALIGSYIYVNYSQMIEYLFKCRFKKLLQETVANTDIYGYYGTLNLRGKSIESVLGIEDKQKINRIRDMDGGEDAVKWMRWSEKNKKKVPQDTLVWMSNSEIDPEDIKGAEKYLNPQQIQNYIEKQKKISYPDMSRKQILGQWEDYLNMCEATGKRMDDEMIYRPRELKRRHDEVITDLNQLRILREIEENKESRESYAREMREKYPEAEGILKSIKERYEYENEDYFIKIPKNLVEIVEDGQALHHCAGSSERYFDRIESRETYICFLRRKEAPGIPYYTIEIEPSGTIRQHRSYLDDEPGIEEIRPFLREWQQAVKRRLTKEDRKLARISERKRYENIEELKQKNNTRVLKALEEDFLENVIEGTA